MTTNIDLSKGFLYAETLLSNVFDLIMKNETLFVSWAAHCLYSILEPQTFPPVITAFNTYLAGQFMQQH